MKKIYIATVVKSTTRYQQQKRECKDDIIYNGWGGGALPLGHGKIGEVWEQLPPGDFKCIPPPAGLHLGFCTWGGGGGGKIAVSAYQGGQALHAVHYNIYSKISRGGGQTSSKGGGQTSSKGGGGNAPLPPLNATLPGNLFFLYVDN